MAPCAEAPHPVGFIRSVGFYPSLASTFPAHYCPLHGLMSFLRAITLNIKNLLNDLLFLMECEHLPIHSTVTVTTVNTDLHLLVIKIHTLTTYFYRLIIFQWMGESSFQEKFLEVLYILAIRGPFSCATVAGMFSHVCLLYLEVI